METIEGKMGQIAPWPHELEDIIKHMEYRPGWVFKLEDVDSKDGCQGLTFMVRTKGYDSYHPDKGERYFVWHYFPVPRATYNRSSWLRWVLDQLIKIETHEACEFFKLGRLEHDEDGETVVYQRPFAPNHSPGWDPYGIRELNTVEEAETTYLGKRQEGTQQ